jgi:phosphate-selective porin OprO/OprP
MPLQPLKENSTPKCASHPLRMTRISFFIAFLLITHAASAQDSTKTVPDGSEGLMLTVPEKDASGKATNMQPNEANTKVSTFKIGMGFIYDVAAHQQSAEFKQQMDSANLDVKSAGKVRDFRVLGSGKINTKREISWKFAFMYNGDTKEWLVRESGITIGVPELFGHIFIGRTKEGFSMVKVMNGHSPWTNERQMALDVIPILADGIKWFGYMPKSRIFWNLGYYNDIISKGQSFSTFAQQYVARVGFLPINNPEKKQVLHVAANLRYGDPVDGKIALKSRPESNPTPQLINTGTFAAKHSSHIGLEWYYSKDRFMVGSESIVHTFYDDSGDHRFIGGDVMLSYMFTKTSRPYKTVGSIYGFVPVRKGVFKGGIGEFEGVLRFSTLNLNDGNIKGGQFWRITPMVNWYMTRVMRLEFIYGYGTLDRFNLSGKVQFFESRIQFTLM